MPVGPLYSIYGSNVFTYNLNMYYDISGHVINNGYCELYIPKVMIIESLPEVGASTGIVSINQIPDSNGVLLVFNFGPIPNGHTEFNFAISLSFGPGRYNHYWIQPELILYGDETLFSNSLLPAVEVILSEDIRFAKFSTDSDIYPGDEFDYVFELRSYDPGYELLDIRIEDILPPELEPVTSIAPVGHSIPENGFDDPTYNGLEGTWNGNTMEFILPSFSGAVYEITFRVRVLDNAARGSLISNTAKLNIGSNEYMANNLSQIVPYVLGSIGNFVWLDSNGDGIYEPGEEGLNGITVNLLDELGNFIESQVTRNDINDNPGYYLFEGLEPGNYVLEFIDLENNYILTNQVLDNVNGSKPNPLNRLTNIINLHEGEDILDIYAGFLENFPGSISGICFIDIDEDGIYNNSDILVPNMEVDLLDNLGNLISSVTTNNLGEYTFNDIRPGNYIVRFTPPETHEFTIQILDVENGSKPNPLTGLTDNIILTSNEDIVDISAGIVEIGTTANIGNLVWIDSNGNGLYDAGEAGLNGVTVNLLDELGNIIATTTTVDNTNNEPGYYIFEFVPEGNYNIQFILPENYLFTQQRSSEVNGSKANETTGITNTINLVADINQMDIIAGLIEDFPGSISGFAWIDLNRDGIYQVGEPRLEGITVNLLDTSNNIIASQITTNEPLNPGFYSFTNLETDDYIIEFVIPEGYRLTEQNLSQSGSKPNIVSGRTEVITIDSGENVNDIIAGFIEIITTANIGNLVWIDSNGNGLYDVGEAGLNGVRVNLLNEVGDVIDTKITEDNGPLNPGYYLFTDVEEGNYRFQFILPENYLFTQQRNSEVNGSKANETTGITNTINLIAEVNQLDIIAGLIENFPGSISGYAWLDSNEDGILEIGEVGLNGIRVNLLDEFGNVIDSQITSNDSHDAPGYYNFTDLEPGNYRIEFVQTDVFILTRENKSAINGSLANPETGLTDLINLGSGQVISNIIAGIIEIRTTANIGNFTWIDANRNGIFESGEVGLNGVTINLINESNDIIATTISADYILGNRGYYSFENVEPGEYRVEFIPPTGYILTIQRENVVGGSTPSQTSGITNPIELVANEDNNQIIAGFILCDQAPVINASDKVINEGSTFNPLTGVTASDCMGAITLTEANVIENTVNPEVPGLYSVTYEVTSPNNGLTTRLTIQVKVCEVTARDQAITDIIESVALEETALARILNAEGTKIQKVLELNASAEDILRISNSVNSMISSITTLEFILQSKLELFKCRLCRNSCESSD